MPQEARPIRVQVPGQGIVEFPAGTDEATMRTALTQLEPAPRRDPLWSGVTNESRLTGPRPAIDTALDALPLMGGMVGGTLGGAGGAAFGLGFGGVPGATGGAALGGATGEAVKQLGRRLLGRQTEPPTPLRAAGDIALEGGKQGAIELGGAGLSRGLKAVGKAAYTGALRPGQLADRYPRVVEQGLADRAIVGPRGSVDRARRLMRQSRDAATQAVADADASGAPGVTSQTPRPNLARLRARTEAAARESTAANARLQPITDQLTWAANRPPMRPMAAHETARELNRTADTAFRSAQRGGPPAGIAAELDRASAQDITAALKAQVPTLAGHNQRTANRFGLSQGLQRASRRPSVLANLMAGGAGLGTYGATGDPGKALKAALLLKGVSSPVSLSLLGIGANEAARLPLAQLARLGLLSQMSSHTSEPRSPQ